MMSSYDWKTCSFEIIRSIKNEKTKATGLTSREVWGIARLAIYDDGHR
ncbi:hypothetical protein [Mucilaginibacter kameinonensis]|nr:hypothetical protein [Mucilaginibacter kameinonensis]